MTHAGQFGNLTLLPQAFLVRTGPVDRAAWNYSGLLGVIQRRRFRLVQHLLSRRRFRSLLEIGYGSGVFLPELAKWCDEVYGTDVHTFDQEVTAALAKVGLRADLKKGGATAIPFPDGSFDCVVAVSVLEFVDDLETACAEVTRVVKPEGTFVVVTPGHSALLDLGLRLFTGQSAKKGFGDRREKVEPTLQRHFRALRHRSFPTSSPAVARLYSALELRKR